MTGIRVTALAAALLLVAACGTDQPLRPLLPSNAALYAKKAATPFIADVSPSTASLDIGVGSTFSIGVSNPSANNIYAGISLSATIVQGNASRAAGSAVPDCGRGAGVLPATSDCGTAMTVTADNTAEGTGTLTAGNAKLVIRLLQSSAGGTPTVLDTKTIKVTLTTAGAVSIADLQLAFSSMEIDGTQLNAYTVTLGNTTGTDRSLYVIQNYVVQGSVVHAGGGAQVCPGLTGVVPAGGCTFDWHTFAQNSLGEPGTLVAGPATLRIDLIYGDGVSSTIVGTREFPIQLTTP